MDNVERNKFRELIEAFSDEDMYLVLVSFISADTLVDQKSCENAYELIGEVMSGIEEADIPEKKKQEWLSYADKSKKIIEQELNNFKSNEQ